MRKPPDKPLALIGIGNSGRKDDGLGWAFLDQLAQKNPPADLHYRYQLQIEDAELIARYEQVIFIDAHRGELQGGYSLSPLQPSPVAGFTTHQLSPGALLYLCENLYQSHPEAQVLAIAGQDWGLGLGLSAAARQNLRRALQIVTDGFGFSPAILDFS